MSAAGVIEFHPSVPIAFIEAQAKAIWSSKSLGRSIALEDPQGRFYQDAHRDASLDMPVGWEAKIHSEMNAMVEALMERFPEIDMGTVPSFDADETVPFVPDSGQQGWRCYFDYYYCTTEDREDFVKLVAFILDHSINNIKYYRDPSAVSALHLHELDCLLDIFINIEAILNFEPNMNFGSQCYIVSRLIE